MLRRNRGKNDPWRLSGSGDWYVYNTTLYNAQKGLSISGVQVHVRNSIANGIALSAWTGCASDSDYNITNLNESITGAHSKKNTVVTFMDAAARDLRLAPYDTAAKDAGQNLFNSPSINDGVDSTGQVRDAHWDIGAFEAGVSMSCSYSLFPTGQSFDPVVLPGMCR